ncbi:CorA Metal Ion Transporter (MIT) Family [Phytophthora palmivora]|uniref:CorA Metal Ion Transporter (MIT) Family n=1 Tax=Phytophthora palmivora TaxID=4796 RepID=A0A2P4Y6J4_9STRA|nr:CorA Metal Ion Transporter (MIT) Family [Phytophthora palmivora]
MLRKTSNSGAVQQEDRSGAAAISVAAMETTSSEHDMSPQSKYCINLDLAPMETSELSATNSPSRFFCRFDPVTRKGRLLMLLFDRHGNSTLQEMSRLDVLRMTQEAAKLQTECPGKSSPSRNRPNSPKRKRSNLHFQSGLEGGSSVCGVQRVHTRDIRRMENAFSASNEPSITLRMQAIFFSADPLRAIVLRDSCLVYVPDGADSLISMLKQDFLSNARDNADSPFEFRALEALLATLSRYFRSEYDQLSPAIVADLEHLVQGHIDSRELERLREFKNTMNEFESQVDGVRRVLMELLDNEEDLRLLYLTKIYEDPELLFDLWSFDSEEAEVLIENYLQDIFSTRTTAELLQHRITNTESLVTLKLDSKRNYLLGIELIFSLVSINISVGTLISGVFGMNLTSGLAEASGWFLGVVIFTIVLFIVTTYAGIVFFKKKDPLRAIILRDVCLVYVPDGADTLLSVLKSKFVETARDDDAPFEFRAVEALLATLSRYFQSQYDQLSPVIVSALDALMQGGLNARELETLREFKNTINEFEAQVDGVRRVLMMLLDNEEDLRLLYLTKLYNEPNLLSELWTIDSEEIEVLIENYLQDIFSTRTKADLMQHRITNTESLVMMQLDSMRNYLLGVDLIFSIVVISLSVGTFIAGVFGMNLHSGLEAADNWFMGVVLLTVALFFLMTITGILYFKSKGVLLHPGLNHLIMSATSSPSSALTFSESDADFERALSSYDVPVLAEALRRYLASEAQASLSAGSATKRQSAQLRSVFYERFNQLLDRIFGLDAVSKQKYGGWLDYSAGLGVAPAPGSAPAVAAKKRAEQRRERALAGIATDEDEVEDFLTSLTTSGRAIVKLLGGGVRAEDGSVFQFLFRVQHPVEFKLALDMLPEQSKMAIVSGRGASLLFTQLLHKPLAKQRLDLRNPELLVSITELYLFYFLRHPASSSHSSGSTTASTSTAGASTASTASSTSAAAKTRLSSWRMYGKDGVAALTRGNPYNVVLLQYLRVFLPDSNRGVNSRLHRKLLKDSNLFLHILIEFWLRQNLISFSDEPVSASTAAPGVIRPPPPGNMLVSPFASVYTSTSYMAPSDDLLSSLLLTIIHLLADSFFPAPLAEDSTSGSQGGAGGMVVGSGGVYLSRNVTMLRPPLYAFFRLVFSRAPIGLSSTAFLAITDVWLAYIQPWHCRSWIESKDPVAAAGTATDRDTLPGYTSAWESYVLANYHFYTTLLGAFVERAKELDFSVGDERNLQIVDRVMSVYNADLLALLRRASLHLEKSQPFAMPFSFNRSSNFTRTRSGSFGSTSKSKTSVGDALTATQAHVLTFYCKSLGIECTPVPLHDSFHRDAERLFDKLWGAAVSSAATASTISSVHSPADLYQNVSAVFRASSTKTVDKVAEQVQRISRMLRCVFEISDAYVASTAHSRSSSAATGSSLESFAPSRDKNLPFLLSREGVFQLQHGMRLCSPDMAEYIGDPMLSPICSYEVTWLVRLSYKLSTWLNEQCGFVNPYNGKRLEDNLEVDPASPFVRFRFNFRFLASKVNLGYITAFVLLLYVLYFW